MEREFKIALLVIVLFLFVLLITISPKKLPGFAIYDPSVSVYVVPAITNDQILPDTDVSDSYLSDEISIFASPGEFEPASFVVHPEGGIDDLQITASALTGPGGSIPSSNVDIKVLKVWYQAGILSIEPMSNKDTKILVPELLLNDDSLVKVENGHNYVKMLDGSYVWVSEVKSETQTLRIPVDEFSVRDADTLQPVDIPAGTNKQFWVTVKVPDAISSGTYTGDISLRSSSGAIGKIDLEVEVLPITLSESIVIQSLYTSDKIVSAWPDGSVGTFRSPAQMRVVLQNMWDHGVTNPVCNQAFDETLLGQYLTIRKDVGMGGQPLYFLNLQPNGYQDPAEVQELLDFVQDYDVTDLYVFGEDEASGDELTAQISSWQAIRSTGAKIAVACSRGAFELVGNLLDLAIVSGVPTSEEAAKWHGVGHLVGDYANPQSGKEEPETYRRNFGLLLWQQDYDVAMTWTYFYGYAHPWNDFDHPSHRDSAFTYPTVNGVIDTNAWEGYREGVDDLRYLSTLLDLIDARELDRTVDTASADGFVSYLKNVNLKTMDLNYLRSVMADFILYLSGNGPEPDWCGNGVVESGEECDNNDLNGRSCSDFGYTGGSMACSNTCTWNDCGCIPSSTSISFSQSSPLDGGTVATQVEISASIGGSCDVTSFINWNDSLVGYWDFNEGSGLVAYDKSGKGNHGELRNGAQWGTGKFGNAVYFDGVDDHVYVPDSSSLEGFEAVTIEAWVYQDMNPQRDQGLFKDDWFTIRDSSWISFYMYNSGGDTSGYLSQSGIDQDKWHHIAAIYDSKAQGENVKFYVDGKLESENHFSGTLKSGSSPFRMSIKTGSAAYWKGSFDEVRMWNRAFSPEEVRASYDSRAYPLSITFSGLSDGYYYDYYAYATDAAGTITQTKPRTVVVDSSYVPPPGLTSDGDGDGNGGDGSGGGGGGSGGGSGGGGVTITTSSGEQIVIPEEFSDQVCEGNDCVKGDLSFAILDEMVYGESVTINVVDKNGYPVEEAIIVVSYDLLGNETETYTTNAEGQVDIPISHGGGVEFTAMKEGYSLVNKDYYVPGGQWFQGISNRGLLIVVVGVVLVIGIIISIVNVIKNVKRKKVPGFV